MENMQVRETWLLLREVGVTCGLFSSVLQDGPMVVGLAPQDASDRLIMFQVCYWWTELEILSYHLVCQSGSVFKIWVWILTRRWIWKCYFFLIFFFLHWCKIIYWHSSPFKNRFDNLFRKYITYTGGEELFGLSVTQHPQLLEIRKQLTLLQKLYGLYNNVIETVNGYYDILWADIHIEKINNELLDFQTRSIYCDVNLITMFKGFLLNFRPQAVAWSCESQMNPHFVCLINRCYSKKLNISRSYYFFFFI